jgi:PIN domain nuclease of toxin-antitoxin system
MFPSHWRELIETANQVGISPVSCYEVALAQQKGRLELLTTYFLSIQN